MDGKAGHDLKLCLQVLKVLVLLLVPLVMGRFITLDAWGGLNDMAVPILGIYLLREEDQVFTKCYESLSSISILDEFCGMKKGVSFVHALAAFMLIAALNSLNDLYMFITQQALTFPEWTWSGLFCGACCVIDLAAAAVAMLMWRILHGFVDTGPALPLPQHSKRTFRSPTTLLPGDDDALDVPSVWVRGVSWPGRQSQAFDSGSAFTREDSRDSRQGLRQSLLDPLRPHLDATSRFDSRSEHGEGSAARDALVRHLLPPTEGGLRGTRPASTGHGHRPSSKDPRHPRVPSADGLHMSYASSASGQEGGSNRNLKRIRDWFRRTSSPDRASGFPGHARHTEDQTSSARSHHSFSKKDLSGDRVSL